MNRHRISLITLVTLVTLVITPAAVAQIYKCDGPDGPIYSDRGMRIGRCKRRITGVFRPERSE